MLCSALYGSTSLQQSSKGSCSLLVSGHNLPADCQWRTLAHLLNSGANAASASVHALVKAVVALNSRQKRVLALGLSRGMNGLTLPIVTLGTIRPEDNGDARNATEFQHKIAQ